MRLDVFGFLCGQRETCALFLGGVAQPLGFGRIAGNQPIFKGDVKHHADDQPDFVNRLLGEGFFAVEKELHVVDGDIPHIHFAEIRQNVAFEIAFIAS